MPALCASLRLAIFVKILVGKAPVPDEPVLDDFVGPEWLLAGLIHIADQLEVLGVEFGFRDALGSTAQQRAQAVGQALIFTSGEQFVGQ